MGIFNSIKKSRRASSAIDEKIELIHEDTWNDVTVDKNRYAELTGY